MFCFQSEKIVSIPSRNFFGEFSQSSNGIFLLAWRDRHYQVDENNYTSKVGGDYYLFENENLIVEGHLSRPNDGKISDNGTFILNDWDEAIAQCGTFLSFDKAGNLILARKFKANLLNNGLDDSGKYAVCQTCNAEFDNDSGRLVVFSLEDASEISNSIPESGWANSYEFEIQQSIVKLVYSTQSAFSYGVFAYGFDGAFVDREIWCDAQLKRGMIVVARQMYEKNKCALDLELSDRLLNSIQIALNSNNTDALSRSIALRLRGEIFESLGQIENALSAFKEAILLNSRIGLKRKILQIQKQLDQSMLSTHSRSKG
jgi:tetratricopeptide (TPR) repeat protein